MASLLSKLSQLEASLFEAVDQKANFSRLESTSVDVSHESSQLDMFQRYLCCCYKTGNLLILYNNRYNLP